MNRYPVQITCKSITPTVHNEASQLEEFTAHMRSDDNGVHSHYDVKGFMHCGMLCSVSFDALLDRASVDAVLRSLSGMDGVSDHRPYQE